MKIVVCIKQVPDSNDIKWTENNTINREDAEGILNPVDMYSVATALKIKETQKDSEVIVVSMGPLKAAEIIRKAISLGCDKGFLLSDKKFAGADTYATAKTLSAFIKAKVPDFDIIICGQFASDGDTAQTGPSLANKLGISPVTYVNNVDISEKEFIVERETETEIEKYSVSFPALLCIKNYLDEIKRPYINGFIKAKNTDIEVLSSEDIGLKPDEIGLKGSPTYVVKAFTPEISHQGEITEYSKDTVTLLKDKIREYIND